ncbi:MAG: SDR family NAD(P)-dependent oxidoreductase [Candidatus Sulfotelmatobacter sp.]
MNSRFLDGKIAFVTGATSGIGQSVAVAFAQVGAKVIGSGRSATGGVETEKLVKAVGGEFQFVPMDLGDDLQIAAEVRAVIDRFGHLDCAPIVRGSIATRIFSTTR